MSTRRRIINHAALLKNRRAARKATKQASPTRFRVEPLESRLLLSADIEPLALIADLNNAQGPAPIVLISDNTINASASIPIHIEEPALLTAIDEQMRPSVSVQPAMKDGPQSLVGVLGINPDLMKAIFAMDAYNRGYNPGVKFGILPSDSVDFLGTQLGNAIIYKSEGDAVAKTTGFYAIAYNYGGETVIAFRGTDDPTGLVSSGDILNGWVIAAGGLADNQAELAFKFYQEVANSAYGANDHWKAPQVTISLTGHSLGGGLAGLVGATYGKAGTVFDNMPFEHASDRTQVYSDPLLAFAQGTIYNPELRALVYGSTTANAWSPDFSGLRTEYVPNEILTSLRILQNDVPKIPVNLGDAVNLPDSIYVDEHSMATLVIAKYADSEVSETAWTKAARYYWPVLYDGSFARDIGMILLRSS